MKLTKQQLDNIFTYHPPKVDVTVLSLNQTERYVAIRDKAKELAHLINDLTPDSREASLAITSVQQASMWANAAIAINE